MSQRHYLLSTSILSSNDAALRDAARKGEATVVEVAECNYHVPLPWFACFRPSDLKPCLVNWEKPQEIMVPCVELKKAIENLSLSLPLFERLTGESKNARDFWTRAMYQLLGLQLPYLTIDVNEMLMNMTSDELSGALRTAVAQTDEALVVMRKSFFQYAAGVLPYSTDDLKNGQAMTDEQRKLNTIALDAAIGCPSPGSFREERRSLLLTQAMMRAHKRA